MNNGTPPELPKAPALISVTPSLTPALLLATGRSVSYTHLENKELKTRLQATEEDLTNTQVALTEVYEMLAGGGENG